MKIRELRKGDIASASEIVKENYSSRYGSNISNEMKAMFSHRSIIDPRYLVVEDKGKVIGCAGYMQSWADYHIYEIFWVNIDPKYQRKGIGTRLVRAVLNEIKGIKGVDKRATTILLTTSKPRFYSKRFGFKTLTKFNRRKHWLMALELDR